MVEYVLYKTNVIVGGFVQVVTKGFPHGVGSHVEGDMALSGSFLDYLPHGVRVNVGVPLPGLENVIRGVKGGRSDTKGGEVEKDRLLRGFVEDYLTLLAGLLFHDLVPCLVVEGGGIGVKDVRPAEHAQVRRTKACVDSQDEEEVVAQAVRGFEGGIIEKGLLHGLDVRGVLEAIGFSLESLVGAVKANGAKGVRVEDFELGSKCHGVTSFGGWAIGVAKVAEKTSQQWLGYQGYYGYYNRKCS